MLLSRVVIGNPRPNAVGGQAVPFFSECKGAGFPLEALGNDKPGRMYLLQRPYSTHANPSVTNVVFWSTDAAVCSKRASAFNTIEVIGM